MPNQLRFAVVVAALTLLHVSICAQTIWDGSMMIAMKYPKWIVIGADSRSTDSLRGVYSDSDCKIQKFGNIVFAHVGTPKFRVGKSSFNVIPIAERACTSGKDFPGIVAMFDSLVKDSLEVAGKTLKYEVPELYLRRFNNHYSLACVFAVCDSTEAKLYARYYRADTVNGVSISIEMENYDRRYIGDSMEIFLPLGTVSDSVVSIYQREREQFGEDSTPEGIVDYLIRKTYPMSEKIGGDVDVITILPDTIIWAKRKPYCAEQGYPK